LEEITPAIDAAAPRSRPRKPGRAVVATLIIPGLGHIYAGHPWRGLVLAFAPLLITFPLLFWAIEGGIGRLALALAVGMALWLLIAADSARLARRAGNDYRRRWYNRWYVYVAVFLLVGVVQDSLRGEIPLKSFRVPAASMEPTLLVGDQFFTDKRVGSPRRGEIIVFPLPDDPTKLLVKRVIGLTGDTVEIRDKKVVLNGEALDEPYAHFADGTGGAMRPMRDRMPPLTVPAGRYFVLGDNRDRSYDSRFWGPISSATIVGRGAMVYFSWNARNYAVRWERIGKRIE